jgi:uncharacterized protein (TIGR03067 family)
MSKCFMKHFRIAIVALAASSAYPATANAGPVTADQVVSYNSGTLPNPTYNNPSAALGGLNPNAGFGSTLTPFNSAFTASNLVEIGPGGSIVLRLSAPVSTNGYTIGVHTGTGLIDADYPNGTNTNPASSFNSFVRQANVMVSADGVNWGSLGTVTFNNPSNYYAGAATDPEGGSPGVGPAANQGQPFLGSLSSFNGETWQQTLATLNGSAGGTWLNLSGVTDEHGNPINEVNFIVFSVPNNPPIDPNTGTADILMLDAVVGIAVPAPPSLLMLAIGAPALLLASRARRRSILAFGLVAALLVPVRAKADDEVKALAKLQGTWVVVSAEQDGQPLDRIKGGTMTIKDGNFTIKTVGGTEMKGDLRIDPTKKPKTIDLAHQEGLLRDKTWQGIYELTDDEFKLCYAEADTGKDRPTDFKAEQDSGRLLIVMKRKQQ